MQTNHANAIRGLSIATIVIAALGLLGCLVGAIALGIGGVAVADYGPAAFDAAYESGYYTNGYDYEYALTGQETADLMGLLIAFGGVAVGWVLLCHVVILVAGIMGLRNCNNPAKLQQVFGWGIGGAVASFLGGGFITMVLLIIVAVFASKDKELAASGSYGAVA